jgi:hypothetical protein
VLLRHHERGAASENLATVTTIGVWATQYREGEARWGVINLVNNQFYPADQGWQPLHP